MKKMWVWSLSQENFLEEETETHAGIHKQRSLAGYIVRGVAELDLTVWLSTHAQYYHSFID